MADGENQRLPATVSAGEIGADRFDLLYLDGFDLRRCALVDRKRALAALYSFSHNVFCQHRYLQTNFLIALSVLSEFSDFVRRSTLLSCAATLCPFPFGAFSAITSAQ